MDAVGAVGALGPLGAVGAVGAGVLEPRSAESYHYGTTTLLAPYSYHRSSLLDSLTMMRHPSCFWELASTTKLRTPSKEVTGGMLAFWDSVESSPPASENQGLLETWPSNVLPGDVEPMPLVMYSLAHTESLLPCSLAPLLPCSLATLHSSSEVVARWLVGFLTSNPSNKQPKEPYYLLFTTYYSCARKQEKPKESGCGLQVAYDCIAATLCQCAMGCHRTVLLQRHCCTLSLRCMALDWHRTLCCHHATAAFLCCCCAELDWIGLD